MTCFASNQLRRVLGRRAPLPAALACLVLLAVLGPAGCRRGSSTASEVGYVAVPQVTLRDRVAAVYAKVGVVKNGEKVEILEKARNERYVRVRSPRGEMGWMEARYLAGPEVFQALEQLAAANATVPVQAQATVRHPANVHVEPARDSEHLYLLDEGTKVQLLKRAVAEKPATSGPAAATPVPTPGKPVPPPSMEDWWLLRDPQGHVGWVLARMVDEDVPLEVAQYAEGRRIVAFFVLNRVPDGQKQVPQFLLLLTDPKDGLPFDFNQVRVFTWNPRKQRYETAYRQSRLYGLLPARVGEEDFGGREGKLPIFILRLQDNDGKVAEHKFKMNTVVVREVLAPGEQKPKSRRAK
ncbi:MAG TPA: SH3 domain-containing protein [Terriglobales bacterium]|nr:SH3 domain-containing protein [Terriglobales bacterium]